jgi:hypothetical protein
VYSGGCSGFRYGMMLEDQPTAEDNTLEVNGVKVYVDGPEHPAAPGIRDRLRRHADGRRLHGQQPERSRGVWVRLELPNGRRRRFGPLLRALSQTHFLSVEAAGTSGGFMIPGRS